MTHERTAQSPKTGGRGRRAAGPLALLGVVLLALNLRAAIAGLAPLLPDVRADLGLSSGTAGLLTTLPVLCFGLLSPFAALLGRRIGIEAALLLAMLGIVAGSLVRTAPGLWWLVAGTVVVGAGITVGNVLVPSIVKQDFSDRQGPVTALTTAALTGGAALAAAVTAPLAHIGLGWRGALLLVGGLAAVAAIAWLPQLRRRHVAPVVRLGGAAVLRSPVTWQLAGFMGMQSLTYYAILAWLPTLLRDAGVSAAGAGWALALFNLLGIATAVAAPALAARRRDQRGLGLLVCATWGVGLLGLLVAPALYLLWATLTGLAQGAGIGLALALLVIRARTPESARDLSGTVQSVGYLLGSTGPVLVGLLHDVSDDWTAPLVALCVAVTVMAAAALGAGRDRQV
ncbi:MFS transporter, CP family, cyanate transporter [Micromonospora rhizosphaerae]|uniref:MFS transporter, CP family, cyanate transporter n=1 Tax=Micromonospora rhizosphaerae TaxID=568872 RepID=A0A1C6SWU2_9ACTN|nr:MFS transporter [Micromonospora rhizosphaerae]SCL33792.1 MFS transporter, CP family, cyanate transporter [Micromonospora rhizosphaerae]